MGTALLLVVFWALALVDGWRMGLERLRQRPWVEWLTDMLGLGIQGLVVPIVSAVGAALLNEIHPGQFVAVGWLGGLALNLLLVDYLYYWNHRLLHRVWPVHAMHHSADTMGVWVSARNTLWTTAFIVYVWVNPWFLWALADPRGYAAGMILTAALDLWRHSSLAPRVAWGLVQPVDHAWHHSRDRHGVNFGANWSWWDRLHGTWYRPGGRPVLVGVPLDLPLWRRLLWPFR